MWVSSKRAAYESKKDDITHKLKIARGQIDGILQMIEEDRYCVDISTQLQSVQALLETVSGRLCKPMQKIRSWRKP